MTRLLLLRHADHDLVGRALAGRMPGVSLNARGRQQAQRLVERLRPYGPTAIHSSPQPRARETVAPLAEALRLPVQVAGEFDEVDFGDWTGWSIERLAAEGGEPWRAWCEERGRATPPGGEPFTGVAARAVRGLERLRREHPEATVLVVSHGDVLRAAVATVLGMSLDDLELFEIAPASITVLEAGDGWHRLTGLNLT